VVKSKRFEARPMTVDEAILQMELFDSSFFVFLNEGDRAVNVVYKRDDGSLGLLEARPGVLRRNHDS
jgi:putative sigma-54 modulation protein